MKINFINLKIYWLPILVVIFVFSPALLWPEPVLADRAAFDQCDQRCYDDVENRRTAGNLSDEDNFLIFQECHIDCQRLLTPEEAANRAEGLRQQAGQPLGINPGELTFTPNVPIGDFKGKISVDSEILYKYISSWYNFVVGVVGILAAVIIMWGGFKWLTSRGNSAAISDAKDRIWSAIIGLVLVFLSYILLNLINPRLLNIYLPELPSNTIKINNVTINNERLSATTVNGGRLINENGESPRLGSYQSNTPNQNLQNFSNNLSDENNIDRIVVNASNTRGQSSVIFIDEHGNQIETPAEIGVNGFTSNPMEGDQSTPLGIYQITNNIRLSSGQNDAIFTLNGQTNLGAAFIDTSASTPDGRNRGIGFHGSFENGLRPTNGCIRLNNEVLELITPYIKPGTSVNIINR